MPEEKEISEDAIDALCARLERDAKASGYFLNPDDAFVRDLAQGLLANEARYGYAACPCRLAEGVKEKDLDMVCPCDYRDADIAEFGACYCALYVNKAIAGGHGKPQPVPERRPPGGPAPKAEAPAAPSQEKLPYPVWRCKVCGYLTARNAPPDVCPICKVTKDRFERFM